jgi:type IV fimbrial biogenesis protein FimT/type IV fimbrial biogenesis protein FimU
MKKPYLKPSQVNIGTQIKKSSNSLAGLTNTISSINKQGFTLIELLVTIAIVSILSILALPSFSDFRVKMRIENQVTELNRLLLTARNSAINSGLNTTVCPLNSSSNCTNDWSGDISVFTNATGDTDKFGGNDTLVKVKEAIKAKDTVKISNNAIITYTPSGRTLQSTANQLIYCPFEDMGYSNGIDISTSGRSYIGSQNDSNTYVDRMNNIFKCN